MQTDSEARHLGVNEFERATRDAELIDRGDDVSGATSSLRIRVGPGEADGRAVEIARARQVHGRTRGHRRHHLGRTT